MADVGNNNEQECLDFELKQKLGFGGFSWTIKGVKSDGTVAALKFTPHVPEDGKERQRQRQIQERNTELGVLEKCKHKHIVALLGYQEHFMYRHAGGEERDTFVFALECCGGGEMFDLIYYTGKFDEKLARTFFRQILLGLQAMHEAGFAHRDIKPQNVLLDDNFQVKLADFGSSKNFEEGVLMRTTRVGTKGYQAPELKLGRGYTKKADLFSCGVLLFVSLTKHPPFKEAEANDQWFRQIAKRQFARFWAKHPRDRDTLGENVRDIFQQLCCYQPLDRIDVQAALDHPWMQEPVIAPEGMRDHLAERRARAMEQRSNDKARCADDWKSINQRGPQIIPPTAPANRIFYCYPTLDHPNKLLKGLQLAFEQQRQGFNCDINEAKCVLDISGEIEVDDDDYGHSEKVNIRLSGYKAGDAMPEDYNHENLTGSFLLDVQMEGFSEAKQNIYEDVLECLKFECLQEDDEESEEEVENDEEEDSDGPVPDFQAEPETA